MGYRIYRSHADLSAYGLDGIRTHGLCLAKAALYQLSYEPVRAFSREFYWSVSYYGFDSTCFLLC